MGERSNRSRSCRGKRFVCFISFLVCATSAFISLMSGRMAEMSAFTSLRISFFMGTKNSPMSARRESCSIEKQSLDVSGQGIVQLCTISFLFDLGNRYSQQALKVFFLAFLRYPSKLWSVDAKSWSIVGYLSGADGGLISCGNQPNSGAEASLPLDVVSLPVKGIIWVLQ